ncbi:hypothetical protein IWX92DRAFT_353854 [Phyllosticta citricarpa]
MIPFPRRRFTFAHGVTRVVVVVVVVVVRQQTRFYHAKSTVVLKCQPDLSSSMQGLEPDQDSSTYTAARTHARTHCPDSFPF